MGQYPATSHHHFEYYSLVMVYAALHLSFNFDATPLANPGTRVLVHLKPSQLRTFGVHVIYEWYAGPSVHNYRY